MKKIIALILVISWLLAFYAIEYIAITIILMIAITGIVSLFSRGFFPEVTRFILGIVFILVFVIFSISGFISFINSFLTSFVIVMPGYLITYISRKKILKIRREFEQPPHKKPNY